LAVVTCQTPLRLSNRSEPEPDLMLLRPRADGYADSHPGAVDALLVIEVADSSARYDRQIKVPLYARYGVAEVWVFDLDAALLRCYRAPQAGDGYAEVNASDAPGLTPLPGLPGVSIDLQGLLR
jgi:Uma2 family endonuclease